MHQFAVRADAFAHFLAVLLDSRRTTERVSYTPPTGTSAAPMRNAR